MRQIQTPPLFTASERLAALKGLDVAQTASEILERLENAKYEVNVAGNINDELRDELFYAQSSQPLNAPPT